MRKAIRPVLCSLFLYVAGLGELRAQGGANPPLLGWVPTEAPPDGRYEGSRECVQRHADQAPAASTPLADARQRASESEILRSKTPLTFAEGPYSHEISLRGGQPTYTVSDGRETISELLLWSFGHGNVGRTYLFQRRGSYIRAPGYLLLGDRRPRPDLRSKVLTAAEVAGGCREVAGGRRVTGMFRRTFHGCRSRGASLA